MSLKHTLLIGILALAGCAGFRGGWTSVAYVGDTPPSYAEPPTSSRLADHSELVLPGLKLGITMNNQLRTYDNQVYFMVLPLVIDPRNVYQLDGKAGTTRVSLRVLPVDDSFTFNPLAARLTVDAKTVPALTALEFGRWDSDGVPKTTGTDWAYRAISQPLLLKPGHERSTLLTLEFPVERVSPENAAIRLDLSDALVSRAHPRIPLIRFHAVRWKEGYT